MEFADGGDLHKLLKEQRTRRKYFSEKDIWHYAYEIMQGLEYLHQKHIMHRDIKCLNIFIMKNK